MAKTRLEIIQEELVQTIDIITHQFVERDIAIALQQFSDMEQINEEIRAYIRRKEALETLLEADETLATGRDFDVIITIQ